MRPSVRRSAGPGRGPARVDGTGAPGGPFSARVTGGRLASLVPARRRRAAEGRPDGFRGPDRGGRHGRHPLRGPAAAAGTPGRASRSGPRNHRQGRRGRGRAEPAAHRHGLAGPPPGRPRRHPAARRGGRRPAARFVGAHEETPLHWAASNDDVAAVDALVACGAAVDATGGVIGGGTPLADARAFGQWRAARRLLEHGARADFQDAAALGLLDRVEEFLTAPRPPGPDEITSAFWGACHGGRPETARYLLARGADLDWIGYDGMTPLDIARSQDTGGAREVTDWLWERGAHAAADLIG
ncbi:ankyrin repeat domain-containing protein [Streptomyces sp. NPDC002138]|uniref:ankyrin repeat domain-containing protein n=1 Tax=Streptomyces sp. NPDC002138 TaxID=3154410 RepID=UPI0033169AF2